MKSFSASSISSGRDKLVRVITRTGLHLPNARPTAAPRLNGFLCPRTAGIFVMGLLIFRRMLLLTLRENLAELHLSEATRDALYLSAAMDESDRRRELLLA